MKKFNNTPNKCITSTEGEAYWISRSCAVVTVVIATKDRQPYVLLNKRGTGSADFQGLWNLPCGYIDWDETSTEAAIREVYEETGLDLDEICDGDYEIVWDSLRNPWFVDTNPASNRQNITLRHGLCFNCNELPSLTNENSEPDEIAEVKWVPIEEAIGSNSDMEFAFEHEKVISYLYNKLRTLITFMAS